MRAYTLAFIYFNLSALRTHMQSSVRKKLISVNLLFRVRFLCGHEARLSSHRTTTTDNCSDVIHGMRSLTFMIICFFSSACPDSRLGRYKYIYVDRDRDYNNTKSIERPAGSQAARQPGTHENARRRGNAQMKILCFANYSSILFVIIFMLINYAVA